MHIVTSARLPPARAQLVERFDRQDGAGGPKGVTQRDAAPVGIGALRRQIELPADGQGLGGKGFVDLEHVDIVKTEAGFF